MHVITRLQLENDLDLMLAHRRSMQAAEYSKATLITQTSFATAVSELSRLLLDKGEKPCLFFGFTKQSDSRTYLYAQIEDSKIATLDPENDHFRYAKRLVNHFSITKDQLILYCQLPHSVRLSKEFIEGGKRLFEELPALSPYEEAKRMNDQVRVIADRLLESEQRYLQLTNTLPLMMFTADTKGHLQYANEAFYQFSGIDQRQQEELDWLKWMSHRQKDISEEKLAATLTDNRYTQAEVALHSLQGEPIWHLLSLTPTLTAAGDVAQWSGFLVNIHAQKVVEQTLRDNDELRHTKEVLEKRQGELDSTISELNRSNKELSRFAYVASHDLQEPSRKMIIFSEILLGKQNGLSPDSQQLLLRIKRSAERMLDSVKDLLKYSQLTVSQDIQVDKITLCDIIDAVKDNLELQIEGSQAQVLCTSEKIIYGNRTLLILLFQNLVSNAIKFAREDVAPVIEIEQAAILNGGSPEIGLNPALEYATISVKDNGIGFEMSHSKRIFEMFQRLHTHNIYEGTGIGLSICKRIAEMHHGQITASSAAQQGSTFTVYLPFSQN